MRYRLPLFVIAIVSCAFMSAAQTTPQGTKFVYPIARRDSTADNFYGTVVADPYRWMEEVDSPQTVDWVKAEGDLTREYLDSIPQRNAIKLAFSKLLNYERLTAPSREGKHWFYFRNSGLQNQPVLFIRDSETGPARVFLDPNTLSADGTIALSSHSFSPDGRYMAYATQSSGADWETWHVRDVEANHDLADRIEWSKFSSASWVGDDGFYYAGYDKPKVANATLSALGAQKLWYHRLGTPQSTDTLIYASTARPDEFVDTLVTEDGRYVFLEISKGNGNSIAWRRPTDPPTAFKPVFALDPDVQYNVLGDDGSHVYVQTNKDAPRFRVAWFGVKDPAHILHDVAPQTADKLENVSLIGDRLYLEYLHDAHSVIQIVDTHGRAAGSIELPGIGSGGLPTAKRKDRIAYYGFASFTYPTTIYRYDTATGKSTVAVRPKIGFDGSLFTTELLFATSKDGTRVPVFVTHRKDMTLDGSTPTILYGYGGFDISLVPNFSSATAMWLQMGGAYALAILRGGGEYGEAWHEAGRLQNKQHVFDDFIGAAQMLIDKKITSTPKLAINGGSNGGLLVGAVLVQRPDLFGAAIPEVGVLDMLRYQKFTVGKAWVPEYGASDASEAQFRWLYAYSPDHNVKKPTAFPPTLVMTSDHDDRVYPAHSFKFAALLQWAQAADAPVLLRVESKAGHGAGRPTDKIIDEVADRYAFLVKNLNFTPRL
jgi:prolyl oligopeptidase